MTRQATLLWIWLIGYITCLVAVMLLGPIGDEKMENLPGHAEILTSIYLPYLLPIIAFWFATHTEPLKASPSTTFRFAAVVSLFFNVVVFLIVASIHFQQPGASVAQATVSFAAKMATILSVLTGPAIGYFFGKAQ